jgi:transcriptional regulator with XRE-family HTH domain
MARAALGWSRQRLATEAGTSEATVKRIEEGNRSFADTLDSIDRTLRDRGCDFADDNWVKAPST